MEKIQLKVEGMTCGGCVNSIQNALTKREGVSAAAADLDSGTVTIEFNVKLIEQPALEKAIVDAGFEVTA